VRAMSAAARRLLTSAVTLVLVTLVVFAVLVALPGEGPGDEESARRLPENYRAALRAQYHLDDPVLVRYGRWIGDLARGDLGASLRERRPVRALLRERLPVSLALNATALAAVLLIATPLGIAAAWKPGSGWDRVGHATTNALYAVPVFWVALLLQWIFAVRLRWLPLFGIEGDQAAQGAIARAADVARHLVMPAACLTYGSLAYVSRFVRAALVEATSGDGGRPARARGASALRYVAVHGIRQAAVPLLTLTGFLLPRLVGGSLLVEEIFNVPGLGSLLFDSVLGRDVPVVLALTLLTGAATLAAITAADLLAAWADPRVRHGV